MYRRRVWEYLLREARPWLTSSLGESVGAPVAYLLALGIGMGSLVDRNGTAALGGVSYLHYIGPALLCAAAVQIAFSQASFATFARFTWTRTMWGITATPVTPRLAADGQVMFLATLLLGSGYVYYLVLVAFGAAGGAGGLLIPPIGALTALACAVWIMTLSASIESEAAVAFNLVLRFGVIPMSLFSASFFPIEQLPWAVRWLALLSPLWHGNELARGAALGGLPGWQAAIHLGFLAAVAISGFVMARNRFHRRLVV